MTFAERLTKAELEAFAREHFVPEREHLEITYRHPFSQGALGLLAVSLVGLTVLGARRALVFPADMTRVRYVGRLRLPTVYKYLGIPLLVAVLAIVARLLAQAYLVPLAFGLAGPAIYLRPATGRAWFFSVRKPERVVELIEELRAATPATGSSPVRTRSAP